MKFDIARAWKDETYRHALSEEQRNALPSNPAGELTSAELEAVYGGGGLPIGFPGSGSLAGSFASSRDSFHSFAVFCQDNLFSLNINSSPNFLTPVNNVCVNGDD